jgi:hypothetical protein
MFSCRRFAPAHLLVGFCLVPALVIFLAGCRPEPQIARYTVPKPESIETPAREPKMPSGAAARPSPSANPQGENLKFETPAGWREIPPSSGFTLKALEAVKDDQRIEVTISVAGGDMTQNMNRWRAQIGLPEVPAAEIEAAFKPREINGLPGQFIEIHQPESAEARQSILGYVVPEGDQTWFIKLRGSTALAEQERENLEAFAQSVKW